MTASNLDRAIGIVAAAIAGIAFSASGATGLGILSIVAALAAAFLAGPAILGDPSSIGPLPDDITAADIKAHRERHGGSISEAVRGLSRRE
ncbi:hypothetical protein [Clavibacter sp. MX14-G9D]|uniref:hypothetical protein n=1 Tax=Clavibacter sp. MX14-G9D TaxID=3064656 RepID=UPI00293F3700|nr:hypothetical protein [Clavibacter sp. MX14-G9D]